MSRKEKTIYMIGALLIIIFVMISYFKMNVQQAAQQRASDPEHMAIVGTWQTYEFVSSDKTHNYAYYTKLKNVTKSGYTITCKESGKAEVTFTDLDKGEYTYSGEWTWVKKRSYYLVAVGVIRFKMNEYKDGVIYSSATGDQSEGELTLWKKLG